MTTHRSRLKLFDDESPGLDRFGVLLVITTVALVTLSLVDLRTSAGSASDIGLLAVTLTTGATLVISLRASGVARRYRRVADAVIGLGMLVAVGVILIGLGGGPTEDGITWSPSPIWTALTIVAPILVVRRLFQHDRASLKTLLGAIAAYLLLALAFTYAFLTVSEYQTTPFFGSPEPTTSFMYYSLVTITTLGYGDLAAATELGRLLSTLEAVIGQVYLVTFVGLIVGLLSGQRSGRTTGAPAESDPSRASEGGDG